MEDDEKKNEMPQKEKEQEQEQAPVEEIEEETVDRKILLKMHKLSEGRQYGTMQDLVEHRKTYAIVKSVAVKENEHRFYIEIVNGFGVKNTLKSLGFRWNPKEKVWVWQADQLMSEKDFKNIMRALNDDMAAFFVADNIYDKVAKVFEVTERVVVPEPQKEEEPAKVAEVKAETLEPAKDIQMANEEVKEEELALKNTQQVQQENTEREITPEEIKQQYIISFRELSKNIRSIEKKIEEASAELQKLMDSEYIYVHYNRKNVSISVSATYNKRDALKSLGYRWNPVAKTWDKYVPKSEYKKEMKSLNEAGIRTVIPVGMIPEFAKKEVQKVKRWEKQRYAQAQKEVEKGAEVET